MNNFFTISPNIEKRIIIKNDLVMCFPAKMPIVPGHVLVSPLRPLKYFHEMTQDERIALFDLVEQIKAALRTVFKAEGFNHAWNEEKVAGQSVDHFHLHVLPRHENDSSIVEYEPRQFLYRSAPVQDRCSAEEKELEEVAQLIRDQMKQSKS